MIFKFGEIFCGPGGLGLGAKKALVKNKKLEYAFKHIWAIDYDLDSCNTYRKMIAPNSPEAVLHKDVRDIDFGELEKADAIAFGFPCNDFSIVGESKGLKGKFGPLYTYGVAAINVHNPMWFLAENVSGIKSNGGGEVFNKILNDLEKAGRGYNLTVHQFKFEEYCVPQTRHRFIIVGIRKDLHIQYRIPAPFTKNKQITAKYALEHPPISPSAPNNEKTKQSERVKERLKYIKWGENAWNSDLPKELRLNVKKAKLSHIYKRLHPQKPSYTITGSGGGGTHVYHWDENRALTNRERARLQTFPDNFIFEGSKESVRKQIGMAVPPKAAKIILEAILKSFAGIPYKWVKENYSYHKYKKEQLKLEDLD